MNKADRSQWAAIASLVCLPEFNPDKHDISWLHSVRIGLAHGKDAQSVKAVKIIADYLASQRATYRKSKSGGVA